ncbi:MAG: hypothetical protein IJA16_00885, partial [Clostridia bacterium]|nr:hypothetical protein [Clostridia bacterium]
MSLWYDVKKKSYAYNAKDSWLRSYVDKIVSALKTEVLEKFGQHFEGSLGRHSAASVDCESGESVQTALDLEKYDRVVGDHEVRTLVSQEEIARKGGDNQIKALIAQEEKSRIATDNEIKKLLSAEEDARIS